MVVITTVIAANIIGVRLVTTKVRLVIINVLILLEATMMAVATLW